MTAPWRDPRLHGGGERDLHGEMFGWIVDTGHDLWRGHRLGHRDPASAAISGRLSDGGGEHRLRSPAAAAPIRQPMRTRPGTSTTDHGADRGLIRSIAIGDVPQALAAPVGVATVAGAPGVRMPTREASLSVHVMSSRRRDPITSGGGAASSSAEVDDSGNSAYPVAPRGPSGLVVRVWRVGCCSTKAWTLVPESRVRRDRRRGDVTVGGRWGDRPRQKRSGLDCAPSDRAGG